MALCSVQEYFYKGGTNVLCIKYEIKIISQQFISLQKQVKYYFMKQLKLHEEEKGSDKKEWFSN